MTTVATDGKSMAADGRMTSGSDQIMSEKVKKVVRIRDMLVGGAGCAYSLRAFQEYFMGKSDAEKPKLHEDFHGIVLFEDGRVHSFNSEWQLIDEEVPMAIGTGGMLALAAMDCGKTPLEAVQLACTRDVFSGGTCMSLSFGDDQ